MASYQGYRSWNGWNISLWINNTEWLYNWAYDLVQTIGKRRAAYTMLADLRNTRTPDGAVYNFTSIYNALDGMDE